MVVQDADVEVIDEHDDVDAAQVLGQADVVQAAVVADGDDASGVDAVVAYPVMRCDALAGGEGVGAGVEGVSGCSPVDGELPQVLFLVGCEGRGWLARLV